MNTKLELIQAEIANAIEVGRYFEGDDVKDEIESLAGDTADEVLSIVENYRSASTDDYGIKNICLAGMGR